MGFIIAEIQIYCMVELLPVVIHTGLKFGTGESAGNRCSERNIGDLDHGFDQAQINLIISGVWLWREFYILMLLMELPET
jgi:hypothetical protein